MNRKALKKLAVGAGGKVIADPLIEWHFRFDQRANRWTRISFYSNGSYRRGLPRVVSRATVAEEVGVPVEAIAAWQAASVSSAVSSGSSDPESQLAVGPGGSINKKPLGDWNIEFFRESGVWRRTRGQRSEVSRQAVAKKVGVSEDLIQRWEEAMIASREQT